MLVEKISEHGGRSLRDEIARIHEPKSHNAGGVVYVRMHGIPDPRAREVIVMDGVTESYVARVDYVGHRER